MMTTDKLTAALVALFEANKPHASITVRDARSLTAVDLPEITVDCDKPESHSAAVPNVYITPVSIVLRAHSGDDATRATLKEWEQAIELLIEDGCRLRDYISASGNGVRCDYVIMASGGTNWDDKVFQATFSGEAWVARA